MSDRIPVGAGLPRIARSALGLTVFTALFVAGFDLHADVKYRYFKNVSAVKANDFHVKKGADGIKLKTASVTHVETGNEAWPDKGPFNPKVDEFDWTAAQNTEEIPAGEWIKVCTEPGSANTATSFFTRNGSEINTKGYSTVTKANKAGANIEVSFRNSEHLFPLRLSSVQVVVDNTGNPDSFGFVPDGWAAPGVPSTFDLNVGELVSFTISGANPLMAVYIYSEVAPLSTPFDLVPSEDILQPTGGGGGGGGTVPSLGTWGIILLLVVFLVAGSMTVLRRF